MQVREAWNQEALGGTRGTNRCDTPLIQPNGGTLYSNDQIRIQVSPNDSRTVSHAYLYGQGASHGTKGGSELLSQPLNGYNTELQRLMERGEPVLSLNPDLPPPHFEKPFIRFFLTPIYYEEPKKEMARKPSEVAVGGEVDPNEAFLPKPDPLLTTVSLQTLPSFYNGLKVFPQDDGTFC
mmetsp:Transcript_11732/g.19801  ORF Transcript_11732/g.19801 Transcript_11732/m.19801 type:complete len:180 (-) Transcript_11732:544-1083(-)